MCGITGIAGRPPVGDGRLIETMRDTLTHRGPDDAGTYLSDDGRVALAHRRLSILDLSTAGRQPLEAPDHGARIVFNGEIYNYLDLRQELSQRGHPFRTDTDTEVVLRAYIEWGRDALPRLNGMFALAIHDPREDSLLLARDRSGEKPLFYRHAEGRLTFASELKALFADPRTPREIDPASLREYLAFGYVAEGRSMLRGIEKLPQGHALHYALGRDHLEKFRYWSLPAPCTGSPASEDELVEEFEALLADAVRRQMIADVPVGILLSGGLDSSLVTAMAARDAGKTVKTFTASFPGHDRFDEAPHARLVAEHFGTEHHELAVEPATLDLLPELAAQYDEPLADSSMVPTYLVTRLVREHATVALGGDGGDELFGGYFSYNSLVSEHGWKRRLPSALRRPLRHAALCLPFATPGRNTLVRWGSTLPESVARSGIFFDATGSRKLLARGLGATQASAPEMFRHELCDGYATPLAMATAVDFRSYLVDDILVKVDRASMLNSLEMRAPLLDHRIIEFAFGRVPDALRANGAERKILPRRLAARTLPASFDLTRKQGFSIPLRSWFRGEQSDFVGDTLRAADPAVFVPSELDRMIQLERRGRLTADHLFAILFFVLWQRHYGVSVGAA